MSLLGLRTLWASVVLHIGVLSALALWKLPSPPSPSADLSAGGGGEEALEEKVIQMARSVRKVIDPHMLVPPVPQRRITVAMPSLVVLPLPAPLPEPAAAAPASESKRTTDPAAKTLAKSKGRSKTATGRGQSQGSGIGNGSGSKAAAYRHQAALVYPTGSQKLHQRGVVKIKVFVNAAGRAEQTRVVGSSGFSALDEAAMDCARASTYVPAMRDGQSISAWVEASFRFQ